MLELILQFEPGCCCSFNRCVNENFEELKLTSLLNRLATIKDQLYGCSKNRC